MKLVVSILVFLAATLSGVIVMAGDNSFPNNDEVRRTMVRDLIASYPAFCAGCVARPEPTNDPTLKALAPLPPPSATPPSFNRQTLPSK